MPIIIITPSSTDGDSLQATPSTGASAMGFRVSIEYARAGLAQFLYDNTGVKHAKLFPEYGKWANVQPSPGVWNWAPQDALVSEYANAGITIDQAVLWPESRWANVISSDESERQASLQAWSDCVKAFATRFQLITWIGVSPEWSTYWPGTLDQYLPLLEITYDALKSVNPDIKVLCAGLLWVDAENDAKNQADFAWRLRWPRPYRKPYADIVGLLTRGKFDWIDLHSLGDATKIEIGVEFIRNLRPNVPILLGDAFPASPLCLFGSWFGPNFPPPPRPLHPATKSTLAEDLAWMLDTCDVPEGRWEQHVADGLTRKLQECARLGLRGVNMGNIEDYVSPSAMNEGVAAAAGGSPVMGLVETRKTGAWAGGRLPEHRARDFSRIYEPLRAKPALIALRDFLAARQRP